MTRRSEPAENDHRAPRDHLAPRDHPAPRGETALSAGSAEFRSSLLLVLTADLSVLLCWLSWSRRSSSAAALALAAVAIPLFIVLATRPSLRRVVTLLARSETNRRYVIVPIGACVVFASLALSLGTRADGLLAASAVRHLGPIDELVVSPDADSRNQVLDALTRARSADVRVSTSVDDLLPLVVIDGALQIGSRHLDVTIVELDVAAGEAFGGRPEQTGLGGLLPLSVGDVAIDRSLVHASRSAVVSRLSMSGFARDVRIVPMIERKGFAVADLRGLGEPSFGRPAERPVVYVAPGTITTTIDALGDRGVSANAQFVVAVSNQGDALDGLRRSSATVALLDEILANPPIGPVTLPADDPIGLGGATIRVAAPTPASVIAVKAAHIERLRAEFDASARSRRLSRMALYTAALACAAVAFMARRKRHGVQREMLRSLGLRTRSSVALESAFLGVSTTIGLGAGAVSAVVVGASIGSFGPIDTSFTGGAATIAQALTFAGGLALVPSLLRPLLAIAPSPVRRFLRRASLTRLSGHFVVALGVIAVVGSVALLRHGSTVWTRSAGFVSLIAGGALILGRTVLHRPPFGRRVTARPVRRLRTRSFAGVAAATGLVVLPVAASQGLAATATVVSPWRSSVFFSDDVDAVGLAEQLVRAGGGRVLHTSTVLVDDGTGDTPATPSRALAAADGLGDGWIPPRRSPVRSPVPSAVPSTASASESVDLPAGTVVISERLASVRGARLRVGDRLVLRDPGTTRSVSVVVHDVVAFPRWAGDIATSIDVFTALLTKDRVLTSRRAVAVSTMTSSLAGATMGNLAPNANATVRNLDGGPSTVNAALVNWLRRAALVTLGIAVLMVLVFRSPAWRTMHWTVVVAAVAFGWFAGSAVGGPPTRSPIGPLAIGFGIAVLCGVSALRILTPEFRVRDAIGRLPTRPKRTGEFD